MATEYPIPTDPEEREYWSQDPPAYEAMERLHDVAENLLDAVYEQVNATGVLFSVMHEPQRSYYAEKGKALPTPEGLLEARERVDIAQAQWTAAVSAADALLQLRQRQERAPRGPGDA